MGVEPIPFSVTGRYLNHLTYGCKNNKRKLGKYICCKILELNQLPKVPKTFALPNELISRSNLSYYYLLLFLSGGGQVRTAVFHTFNIKSLYSFLFF